MLAQAGYPDGIEFELMWHRTGPQWETGAQIIQASAKEAGINITLKGEEVATLLTRLRDSRDYQAGFSATAVKPTYYHSLWDSIGRQHSHYAGIPERHPEWWQRLQDATALEPDAFREEMAALVREHEAGQFVLTMGQPGGVRLAEQGPGRPTGRTHRAPAATTSLRSGSVPDADPPRDIQAGALPGAPASF